jgi:hypothetical protein
LIFDYLAPYEWQEVIKQLEMLDDIEAYDKAKKHKSEAIPFKQAITVKKYYYLIVYSRQNYSVLFLIIYSIPCLIFDYLAPLLCLKVFGREFNSRHLHQISDYARFLTGIFLPF